MRQFYTDEGPIDTLLQLAEKPIWDGDLVSKYARDCFVEFGWAARCEGWNIITETGRKVIHTLRLARIDMVVRSYRPGDGRHVRRRGQ